MTPGVDYQSYVEPVRIELMKLIRAGKVTYYGELGRTIGKPARWTQWKKVLDEISFKKPDISIIVLLADSGWPGQVDYSATEGKPTPHKGNSRRMKLPRCSLYTVPANPFHSFLSRRNDREGFGAILHGTPQSADKRFSGQNIG
jgi:hypothetical protein